MPRRKKTVLKKQKICIEVETSDDQEEPPKRSLRSRTKAKPEVRTESSDVPIRPKSERSNGSKGKAVKGQQLEYAYDADSERDQRPDDSDTQMTSNTESDIEFSGRFQKKNGGTTLVLDTNLSIDSANHEVDKENFTPPGSHSTPALAQRAVRNLDDSLFGFNKLTSPLPYSPVTLGSSRTGLSPSSLIKNSPSSSLASLRTTQDPTIGRWKGKRKIERPQDLPLENPKKGKKKKTRKELPINDDYLEEMREQFKEVEMHELAVEYS